MFLKLFFLIKIMKKIKEVWREIVKFFRKDSWTSLIVTLILAFVLIKFIFFPLLSLITGTALPLVIVESCSMYHSEGLEEVMKNEVYANYNLNFSDTNDWSFKNGLSKGDVIFVLGIDKEDIEVGDVVIFEGGSRHPIIHRVIKTGGGKITTKGDHNSGLLGNEVDVDGDLVVGRAVFRVPLVGWVKLIFYEFNRAAGEKGLCK